MQPYVHLGLGLVASQALFPEDSISQALVVGASLAPDISWLSLHYIAGMSIKKQSKVFVRMNEIAHSFFIWLFLGFWWPVFVGVYLHLIADWISHKDEKFQKSDPSMIWPLPFLLNWINRKFKLIDYDFSGLKLRGLFEYRKGYGVRFTLLENVIFIFCIFVFVWLKFF